ncbi:MAG TPA: PQQ-dependent sugar dehydrogenase [Planctomycetota bacterium]
MRAFSFFAVVAALLLPAVVLAGTPQDVNFAESAYASGLSQITSLAWSSDGLFVAQKTGALRVVRNGTLQGPNVLSIPVFTSSECGLIGLAVHPSYASNKLLYLFATINSSTQRIYRYTIGVDGSGNLVGQSQTQIGPDLPCRGVNHDGGGLAIGPDGNLYFGVGNLGNGNNVGGDGRPDELTSLASKVGRMTQAGAAVSTNPWYDAADGITARDYIWAKGFRNPFGLRFHPTTGALWMTEVGDGWEQIFLVTQGSTQGWPTENNTSTTNGKLIPKLAYQTNVSTFGGCITRGVFYTGATFPSQYQRNLFFVDYNSGKVMRCVMDASGNNISNTSVFVSGNSSLTDIVQGPDGSLYYSSHGGTIYRLAYAPQTPQNMILSTTSLSVNETSSATFTVKLATAPAANVTVTVARTSGTSDVTPTPTSLTFTPSTWNTPATVTVSATDDVDLIDEGATITCSSSGLASQKVVVIARDNDRLPSAPRATITQPKNGDTVSGATAEFYGDGTDDVGAVRAEFFVDGVLQYNDVNSTGHYHIGGDHLRWNTTTLSNGTHTLRMTVYDAGGQSGSHEITVTVSNAVSGSGLRGDYYDNADFTAFKLTRTDATVNFNWGSGSPDPAVGADTFSVRWTGQVMPQFTETYTFYTTSDDGVRLWVNNVQVINNWTLHGPTENSGTISLTSGRWYEIKMEFYENGGGAVATLSWSSPSRPKEIIPSSRLAPGASFKQDAGADGLAVAEAENNHANISRNGKSWTSNATAGYSGTGALIVGPNTGVNQMTGYAASSPRLDYKINFVKTGVHHVWVRGIGANGSDDSCHVGLDGVELGTADAISSFGTGWTWSRATMDGASATINVTTPGVHTVNVWMREDGFIVDKLLLSVNVNYAPSGTGPAESPK